MPQQDERQNYIKDFPFLKEVPVDRRPLGLEGSAALDKVTVRVERADASLMFRDRVNAYSEPMYVGDRRGQHRNMARQSEELYMVAGGGLEETAPLSRPAYPRKTFHFVDFGKVEYLVWVRTRTLYNYPADSRQRQNPELAGLKERSIHITIYRPPREGWAELYRTARLSDSVLTDHRIREGCEDHDPDWLAIKLRLDDLAKEFGAGPYARGIRSKILEALEVGDYRMAGEAAGTKLRSYVMSGCILMNIYNDSSQVTFWGFASEKDHREAGIKWMGMNSWKGIYGSISQAEQLVKVISSAWPMPSFQPRKIRGPF